MTWRAFLIGLIAALGLSVLAPYSYFVLGNTPLADYHLPVGGFFALVLIALGLNIALKLLRRAWALKQKELMLIWCMLIAACAVGESGLNRYFLTWMAAPTYYANREEFKWEDTLLPEIPDALVVSKDLGSRAIREFFEGPMYGEAPRIPWGQWARPIATWGGFLLLFWLSNFFLFGLLRKQWVENERLSYPLARIPLEFTHGSDGTSLLPAIMRRKAFWIGAGAAVLVMGIQVAPAVLGLGEGTHFRIPFSQIFQGTPLEHGDFRTGEVHVLVAGIAFILPSEISFSFWFIWLLMRFRFVSDYYMGFETGHDWSPYFVWQQAGSFFVLGIALLIRARRHLWQVAKAALWLDRSYDDSEEPVGYRVCFWGMVLSFGGMLIWCGHFGLNPLMAALVIGLNLCALIVQGRTVAQGGLISNINNFQTPIILSGLGGGYTFTQSGAVAAYMQDIITMYGLRGHIYAHAANANKIAEIMGRGVKLLIPAMVFTMVVAAVVTGWTMMHIYYSVGALNLRNTWGSVFVPLTYYQELNRVVTAPRQSADPHVSALIIGGATMAVLMYLRMRFLWWPLHWIGFVTANNGFMSGFWIPFLLGWLAKTLIMKFGTGRTLRLANTIAFGVLITGVFFVGLLAVLGLFDERFKAGSLFLPQ